MNKDGKLRRLRQFHLSDKDFLLHVARRVIVEIVEADLAPCDHARIARQIRHARVMFFGNQSCFVRVNSQARVNLHPRSIRLRQTYCDVHIIRTIAIPNRQYRLDACRFRALKHIVAILRELWPFEMTMGIDVHVM